MQAYRIGLYVVPQHKVCSTLGVLDASKYALGLMVFHVGLILLLLLLLLLKLLCLFGFQLLLVGPYMSLQGDFLFNHCCL